MFGANPIRSAVTDPRNLAVEEVFYTIQGEGPFSGMPALFIRLAGCNLACHFCDTQFETMAEKELPVGTHLAAILADFTPKQRKLVVLTGGEPLRQAPEVLVDALLKTGTEIVQIETAGTLPMSNALESMVEHGHVVLVCSPKTPRVHPQIDELCHHWKYVIRVGETDPEDGLPNRGTQIKTAGKEQRIYRPTYRTVNDVIWLSPCDEHDQDLTPNASHANMLHARDLCLKHGYRLSLQVHKIIGVA